MLMFYRLSENECGCVGFRPTHWSTSLNEDAHICVMLGGELAHIQCFMRGFMLCTPLKGLIVLCCVCVSVQNSLWEEYGSCSLSFWMIRFTSSSEWFTQLNHHYADQSFLKNIPPNVVLCIFARVQCVQEIAAIAKIYISRMRWCFLRFNTQLIRFIY